MSVAAPLLPWGVDPPVDNRPASARWPRWRLLLDDPQPRSALVVGDAHPDVERWLAAIDADVRWTGAVRPGTRSADLVVIGADALGALTERTGLAGLARVCAVGGAVWLPGRRTRRRDHALAAAGFPVRRWRDASGDPAGSGAGVVAARLGPPGRAPRWLADVGAGVGWDGGEPWSLTTPARYPSQKAVAMLGDGPPSPTRAVVKLAQDPRADRRVRNEARALRALAEVAPDFATRRIPAVLREETVGSTAAVVEEALVGRPFLDVSTLRPDCPHARDAADAVTELAAATVASAPGASVAQVLDDLHRAFIARHRPPFEVAQVLARCVELVAARPEVPTVVVHGDLGTWNLLVADGRVRILDWESAAGGGPPLWDLAYMARSFAVRSGRRRGLRRAAAIRRHLVDGSPLTTTMAGWVQDHCATTGIDPDLARALYLTCWMHRAVKEAARLPDGDRGHYGPLCTYLVEQRRAPGLRHLLGG